MLDDVWMLLSFGLESVSPRLNFVIFQRAV
jgi:hypothetical protein